MSSSAKKHEGEVVAVGEGDVPVEHREGSEVIDLAGAVVLPGLQDAHIHIGSMGESARYVDLSWCQSVAEVQQTIKEHADENPELPWIIGTGWNQNLWSPPKSLTRFDLDDPASLPVDRPCLLYRRCWHAAVVNTAAMRAAGIDPEKPWPTAERVAEASGDGGQATEAGAGAEEEGGGVELDKGRRPTGLFRENSMRLVESAVTPPSFETRCEQFAEALDRCVRSGLTAVHSNDENARQIYAHLQNEGRLPVRVYLTLPHDELNVREESAANIQGHGENEQISLGNELKSDNAVGANGAVKRSNGTRDNNGVSASVKDADGTDGDSQQMETESLDNTRGGVAEDRAKLSSPRGDEGGLVSWHRVKLFADGSLGAETAAMRVPYANTANKGVLIHDPASLAKKVSQARDLGFRLEIHAIGDRAVEAVLDAFSDAGLTADDRPIVTHCQVAGPDLRARMKDFGTVAAVQPSFVPSDTATVMKRLSSSVHASCYPWRSLMVEGITCAGSSDAPIETHEPLRGMYDAVFRPDKPPFSSSVAAPPLEENENSVVVPFLPDERLTLDEAVWFYTMGGAIAAGEDGRLGAIRPGFLADLTVLEVYRGAGNLRANPSLLLEAKVSQVWVGGACTWNAATASMNGRELQSRVEKISSNGERDATHASSAARLAGSNMPGKNGPPVKRQRSDSANGGSGRILKEGRWSRSADDGRGSNIWRSGNRSLGRIGRCRCCS